MLHIEIICVGKKHDTLLADAINFYEKKLRHYCKITWNIIPSSDKDSESEVMLNRLNSDDMVILLDETGSQATNKVLADLIDSAQNNSVKRLVLIIGGAYGVNDTLKDRADRVVGLSALVFPHQLVRLILAEQLYRSYSILSGSKYHHN